MLRAALACLLLSGCLTQGDASADQAALDSFRPTMLDHATATYVDPTGNFPQRDFSLSPRTILDAYGSIVPGLVMSTAEATGRTSKIAWDSCQTPAWEGGNEGTNSAVWFPHMTGLRMVASPLHALPLIAGTRALSEGESMRVPQNGFDFHARRMETTWETAWSRPGEIPDEVAWSGLFAMEPGNPWPISFQDARATWELQDWTNEGNALSCAAKDPVVLGGSWDHLGPLNEPDLGFSLRGLVQTAWDSPLVGLQEYKRQYPGTYLSTVLHHTHAGGARDYGNLWQLQFNAPGQRDGVMVICNLRMVLGERNLVTCGCEGSTFDDGAAPRHDERPTTDGAWSPWQTWFRLLGGRIEEGFSYHVTWNTTSQGVGAGVSCLVPDGWTNAMGDPAPTPSYGEGEVTSVASLGWGDGPSLSLDTAQGRARILGGVPVDDFLELTTQARQ